MYIVYDKHFCFVHEKKYDFTAQEEKKISPKPFIKGFQFSVNWLIWSLKLYISLSFPSRKSPSLSVTIPQALKQQYVCFFFTLK